MALHRKHKQTAARRVALSRGCNGQGPGIPLLSGSSRHHLGGSCAPSLPVAHRCCAHHLAHARTVPPPYLAVGVAEASHKQAGAKFVHHVHDEGGVVAQQARQRRRSGGLEIFTLCGAVDLDQAEGHLVAARTCVCVGARDSVIRPGPGWRQTRCCAWAHACVRA